MRACKLFALLVLLSASCAPLEMQISMSDADAGDVEEDAYYAQVFAAIGDPTLTIVDVWDDPLSYYIAMAVEGWDYPLSDHSITCYIDGGAYTSPLWMADGTTQSFNYTFTDVPKGWHQLCCVLTEDGTELENSCSATACVAVTVSVLCDYLGDPICDDGNPVSAEACLWDNNIEHRRCHYGPVDVTGICLSKYDCGCYDGVGWNICLNDNTCAPCYSDGECDDSHPCTVDSCLDLGCVNAWMVLPEGKCCTDADDPAVVCDDSSFCTDDECVDINAITGVGHCINTSSGCEECTSNWDCEDEDPCTIDLCMFPGPSEGCKLHCRHLPTLDPLCCNPANGSDDCWTVSQCITSTCYAATNQCVFGLLPLDQQLELDLQCCETHVDCQAGGVWEEQPEDDPKTLDICNQSQCVHVPDPGYCECTEGCELPCMADADPCTQDICDLGTNKCVHEWIPSCCETDADCDDGIPWTSDLCIESLCENEVPTCDVGADCPDGNPCTEDWCIAGNCKWNPIQGCCLEDAECDDGNDCTLDLCGEDPVTGQGACSSEVDPATIGPVGDGGCCNSNGDCEDSTFFTIDTCSNHHCHHNKWEYQCYDNGWDWEGCNDSDPCTCDLCIYGVCINLPVDQAQNYPGCDIPLNCCETNADCDDDGNPCTEKTCKNNLCVDDVTFEPPDGCCQTDEDCDDGLTLTTDICAGFFCVNLVPSCDVHADCDDCAPCTEDLCIAGSCKWKPIEGCCLNDADCDDSNDCSSNECVKEPDAETGLCAWSAKPGVFCCDTADDCDDGDSMTDDICLDFYCHHIILPYCCGLPDMWPVVCADDDPCTCDFCAAGICRHVHATDLAYFGDLPPGWCALPLVCYISEDD